MGLICFLLSALFVGLFAAADGALGMPGPAMLYLYVGLGFLAGAIFFWRRPIWRALVFCVDWVVLAVV
jgi:hypothetical protein